MLVIMLICTSLQTFYPIGIGKSSVTMKHNYNYINNNGTYRLVVIFQETARNHFWQAGMLMQSFMLETVQ